MRNILKRIPSTSIFICVVSVLLLGVLNVGVCSVYAQEGIQVHYPDGQYSGLLSPLELEQAYENVERERTREMMYLVVVFGVAVLFFVRRRALRMRVRPLLSFLLVVLVSFVSFVAPHTFIGNDIHFAEAAVAVQARNTSKVASDTTSHSVSLPASISSGNLIIVQISSSESPTVTFSATGYTNFGSTPGGGGQNVTEHWFYRIADGLEGASVTFTSTANGRSVHRTWRITGHDSATAPEYAGFASTGSATDIDPPNLTPSWGSAENLWLVGATIHGERDISAAPANYTDFFDDHTGTGSDSAPNVTLGSAERIFTASSEDPGTFTSNKPSGRHWAASTVAIKPAAADPPVGTGSTEETSVWVKGGTTIKGGVIFR